MIQKIGAGVLWASIAGAIAAAGTGGTSQVARSRQIAGERAGTGSREAAVAGTAPRTWSTAAGRNRTMHS